MKRTLIALTLILVMVTGCAMLPDVLKPGGSERILAFTEASAVAAYAFFDTHKEVESDKERGLLAVAAADLYLAAVYGEGGILGFGAKPKWTYAELVNSISPQIFENPNVRRLAYAVKIALRKDGTVAPNMTWVSALAQADAIYGIYYNSSGSATINSVQPEVILK